MEERTTETLTEPLTEKIKRWESIYADTVRRHELMEMGFKKCWGNRAIDEFDEINHDIALIREAEYEVDLAKKYLEELKAQKEVQE